MAAVLCFTGHLEIADDHQKLLVQLGFVMLPVTYPRRSVHFAQRAVPPWSWMAHCPALLLRSWDSESAYSSLAHYPALRFSALVLGL